MSIRILLADDHEIVREGLHNLLARQPGMEIVGEAGTGLEAVRLALETQPDVVLMDVAMPQMNGIEATREIVSRAPNIRVLALSMHSDRRFVLEMLRAGASGYVAKDCDLEELLRALHTVSAGESYLSPGVASVVVEDFIRRGALGEAEVGPVLTPREREVVQLLAEGHNVKQIALALGVSAKTVEVHRCNIMNKLNIHSLAELTKYALREGLTSLES